MKKSHLSMLGWAAALALMPAAAFAGDPIPGIGVSLEQIPGGIMAKGTTARDGSYTSATVPAGTYAVKCTSGACAGKTIKTVTLTASGVVRASAAEVSAAATAGSAAQ